MKIHMSVSWGEPFSTAINFDPESCKYYFALSIDYLFLLNFKQFKNSNSKICFLYFDFLTSNLQVYI